MTVATTHHEPAGASGPGVRAVSWLRRLAVPLQSGWLLTVGFLLTQASIVMHGRDYPGPIYGDVGLYEAWARGGIDYGQWPVLDIDWVYPVGALVPITLPALVTSTHIGYEFAWTAMVVALDAVAVVLLCRHTPRGMLGAWWWLAFLFALGPIAVGRLEGVIAPIMVVALIAALRRPALAAVIATIGAWIKIAPGAIVVVLCTTRRTGRDLVGRVLIPAAATTTFIVGLALGLGAGPRALSVAGEQSDRTLQSEAVAGTWFSVSRLWDPSQEIVNNHDIKSYEFAGDAARSVADMLDLLLPLSVLVVAAVTHRAVRRRPDLVTDIMLVGTAATVLTMIVFNKVGSPQFIAWLGPPVAVGIAASSSQFRRLWTTGAVGLVVAAALTHVLYPLAYGHYLLGTPWMVLLTALRNLALVVGLAVAVVQLTRLGHHRSLAGA